MSSNSENSSIDISDDSEFDVPSDIDIPLEFENATPTPPPVSPEPYLSFVQKTYPLSFFYDYESVKLKEFSNRVILPMFVNQA